MLKMNILPCPNQRNNLQNKMSDLQQFQRDTFLIPQRTEAGKNDNNFYYCYNNNISYSVSWDALCSHRNAWNLIVLMSDSEYVCQETNASLQQPRLPD